MSDPEQPPVDAPASDPSSESEPRLVTIADAAALTGSSKKALRSRVDRGSLPFVLEDGVRKIDVHELERAGLVGDDGEAIEQGSLALDRGSPGAVSEAGTGAAPGQPSLTETGQMLVPLSDWERLMDQVSNVFELSRELAESSARAAKAETQSEFFRDRFQEERDRARELAEELAALRDNPPAPPRRSWFRRRP